ncbi:sugar-binding transcriptional regulator [Candidatus Aquiluna sp. UB-MaderosW2red]|uniref:sugar-binding transcriptional regulator n=1 Tax=Candidatus Aquiluna sp. UB-MaderosW2red TaxID=1855377 RepID=UPI000875DD3B|nr:sugar-binding domain-containing protein [Candidatus Aquiluna sp. UB-MaderosW2red]SCX13987.1 DNA-binding transcriptional regulator LsrR, DeoR family [Candidatus Aquiluna sp. UB-MaderosW2red]
MDNEEAMLAASSMYYLQDVKMETIASHLHMSRSTVSRLLKRARESGLVEITLRPTPTKAPGVGKSISQVFGVETYVVPVSDSASGAERLEQVAMATARIVTGWFHSDMVLGVAWGTTLSAIAKHLQKKPTRGSAIVQLNGAANNRTSGDDYVGALILRFGDAFDASVHLFPVPAFFDFAQTREAMWRERSVARVLDVQRRADIALFSIGALTGMVPSHVYSGGYLEPEDIELLNAEGVVGDVCTVFLRADGTYEDLPLNERATGPTPKELKQVPIRICAVAGDNKVVPLLAALRADLISHLVIDEQTATKLVELIKVEAN